MSEANKPQPAAEQRVVVSLGAMRMAEEILVLLVKPKDGAAQVSHEWARGYSQGLVSAFHVAQTTESAKMESRSAMPKGVSYAYLANQANIYRDQCNAWRIVYDLLCRHDTLEATLEAVRAFCAKVETDGFKPSKKPLVMGPMVQA